MSNRTVYHKLAGPIVFEPVFDKLEKTHLAHSHTLKESFNKVEEQYPGFSQEFLMAIIGRLGLEKEIDVSETYLRMASLSDTTSVKGSRVPEFHNVEIRAQLLKKVLSRIPDEISERKKFLETIKEIASSIKNLLDSVSAVYNHLPTGNHKTTLEVQKRDFVRYSKRFSTTLKAFFQNNIQSEVFSSANLLIHQTNLILFVVRDAA